MLVIMLKSFIKKTTAKGKQQVSYFSKEKNDILSIVKQHGQSFYKVNGQRPLLRNEMLKVG